MHINCLEHNKHSITAIFIFLTITVKFPKKWLLRHYVKVCIFLFQKLKGEKLFCFYTPVLPKHFYTIRESRSHLVNQLLLFRMIAFNLKIIMHNILCLSQD